LDWLNYPVLPAYSPCVAQTRLASKATLAADVWRDLFSFFWSSGSRNAIVLASQELGVTAGHVKTLLELQPDQPRPMGALAESMHCDASNATWLVDRLEERGLVERGTVPTDRRVKTVVLTPLGAKTRAAVIDRLHEPPEDLLALDREDLEELRAALAKLPKSELPFGA
jgi:DNA-binding MarR family transcriptional regulator